MIQFIREALRRYKLSSAVIVLDATENHATIETCDGNLIIEVKGEKDLGEVLELCGTSLDHAVEEMAEVIATKMCSLVHDGMGGLVTQLDINHINSAEIEKHILSQKEMMLDYLTNEFIYPDKIKRGES